MSNPEKPSQSSPEEIERKRMEKYLGSSYANLIKVDAVDFAKKISEELEESATRDRKYETGGDSLSLDDIYVDDKEKIVAALLEKHEWLGSGGVRYDKVLELQKEKERARLCLNGVVDQYDARYDIKDFQYKEIETVENQNGYFLVKFKGDESWWMIESGKNYNMGKQEQAPIGYEGEFLARVNEYSKRSSSGHRLNKEEGILKLDQVRLDPATIKRLKSMTGSLSDSSYHADKWNRLEEQDDKKRAYENSEEGKAKKRRDRNWAI